jgi:beta-glucosidase
VEAVAAARAAEVAIVFVADHVSEGADRTDLRLPGDQDALIEAVAAANPNTVVVVHSVGPVLMPWRDRVGAIFSGWYAGEQAGPAISNLLFGRSNPSGKLPVTFPADELGGPTDRPEAYPGLRTTVKYDENLLVGYRWYDSKKLAPLYPFGHGLSYTRFEMSDLRVRKDSKDGWQVTARVRNVGGRAGAEVAQLYVTMPDAAGEPPLQLKGFERVELRPGERKTVRFPSGTFEAAVGSSSRDLKLKARFDPGKR